MSEMSNFFIVSFGFGFFFGLIFIAALYILKKIERKEMQRRENIMVERVMKIMDKDEKKGGKK